MPGDSPKLSRRALCALGITLPTALRAQPVPRVGPPGNPESPGTAPTTPIATVAIAPLGVFPPAFVTEIELGLRAELGVNALTLPVLALPTAAYYPPRHRYRAERLLDFLRTEMHAPATRILGVTEVDISTTARGVFDWGLLGLGDISGAACVISTFRCGMRSPSVAQTHFRMVTTCIHEVGHTLGLEHCPDTRCLMTDARGSVLTVDRTTGHMCNRCRIHIGLATR